MTPQKDLSLEYRRKLLKALAHLEYSFNKIQSLTEDTAQLDEESLEVWESFSARFSRVSDIYLTKYVKSIVLKSDPGFSGVLRDYLNQGEKLGVVEDVEKWMEIRALRNISAHDYTEDELTEFFKQLKNYAPILIAIKQKV